MAEEKLSRSNTPPWVEQYLYHLDKSVRMALFGSWKTTKGEIKEYRHYCSRLVTLRNLQHKQMREALYTKSPLWERLR